MVRPILKYQDRDQTILEFDTEAEAREFYSEFKQGRDVIAVLSEKQVHVKRLDFSRKPPLKLRSKHDV